LIKKFLNKNGATISSIDKVTIYIYMRSQVESRYGLFLVRRTTVTS